MKKITIIILFAGWISGIIQAQSSNVGGYDTTRLYNAFIKALRGDTVTLAYIGGSITAGYAASTEANRWVNRVTEWWKAKFPAAHFQMVNAGLGGTGSDIGMFRLQRDVLRYNPDFIVVEFSVNDAQGTWATTSMEGLIRQILMSPNHPAVMMLMLKQSNGTTAKASHEVIGNYYRVPMISFADLVDSAVNSDNRSLESIFVDGLHPNDVGMQYIAHFITTELEKVYEHVPSTNELLSVDSLLPTPYITSTYDRTYMYTNTTIDPVSNSGWETSGTRWVAHNPGDEMVFEVEGNSIAVLFSKHNNTQWGTAEIWVDDKPHKFFEAYWTQTWGPATVFGLVDGNLPDGKHLLHVRISESLPAGSSGHTFYLLNVLKAGNIGHVAPIAVPSTYHLKLLKDSAAKVNASKSYDPEGDSISHFIWSIIQQPAGSMLNLINISPDTIVVQPNTAGIYQIGLQVSDSNDTSVMKLITVEVRDNNHKPIAFAGNDTMVKINTTFFLNAYRSFDSDNDILSYSWRVIEQPRSSHIILGKPKGSSIPIKVDTEGAYAIGLTVNDGFENSEEDTIWVIASITGLFQKSTPQIRMFPNPAHHYVYVEGIEGSETVRVEITSIDGTLCLLKHFQANKKLIIPVSNLKPGVYWVNLYVKSQAWKGKIVKW